MPACRRIAAVMALGALIYTGLGLKVEMRRHGGIALENLSNRAMERRTLVIKGVDMQGREIWVRRVFIRYLGGLDSRVYGLDAPEAWRYRFGEE